MTNFDELWKTLQTSWGVSIPAGDLLEEGVTFGMESETTPRGFVRRKRLYSQAEMQFSEADQDLAYNMEIVDLHETPIKELDMVNEELTNLFGDEIGPYELDPISIHRVTFIELLSLGADRADAFDCALTVNAKMKEVETDRPGLTRSAWIKSGAFADEDIDISFHPVVESEDVVLDQTRTRLEAEGDCYISEEKARRAAEQAHDSNKPLFGWLESLTRSRELRYRWLHSYLLSCSSIEQVKKARTRLIEAIDINNTQCRKMEALGNKTAWVGAILAPIHKSKLMKLANKIIRGEEPLRGLSTPSRATRPWMPRPITEKEKHELLHPQPRRKYFPRWVQGTPHPERKRPWLSKVKE